MSRVSALFWGLAEKRSERHGLRLTNSHATTSQQQGSAEMRIPEVAMLKSLLCPSRRVALGKSVPQFPCLSTGDKGRMTSDENL